MVVSPGKAPKPSQPLRWRPGGGLKAVRSSPANASALHAERDVVTICTAAIFSWNYSETPGAVDGGLAIVAACDRMLTDEGLGIEYEGDKWKAAIVTRQHMVLIAGAMAVHSDVVRDLQQALLRNPHLATREIADEWSALLRRYTRKEAAQLFLSPLNLDETTFISQSKLLDPALVIELSNQLQGHTVDAEALVIGCDEKTAHLYYVNKKGTVKCHDDIGFVSIGTGGIHASAHFMLESYSASSYYYKALFAAFSAKKKAEVAPAVGNKYTDMFLITRGSVSRIPDPVVSTMQEIYDEHAAERQKMVARDLQRIVEADTRASAQPPPAAEPPPPNEPIPLTSSSVEPASANPSPEPSGAPREPDASVS
jgi:hypothetical protein